jgi:NDP-sugar pyrophosphorylase family protein
MSSGLPPVALLAGGLATRLRPFTETVPKSLLMLRGEPFLAYQLRLLASQGLRDVVICCGHLGNQIEDFAEDGARFGCRVRYSHDGEKLLGTGGALRRALPLLGRRFFVLYGDSYLIADPVAAWSAYQRSDSPALMCVFRNEGQWDASNAEVADGKVLRYDKRMRTPGMQYIDYGLSVLDGNVLETWFERGAFDLGDVFRELAAAELLAAHEVGERFYEIGSVEGLHELEGILTGEIMEIAGSQR